MRTRSTSISDSRTTSTASPGSGVTHRPTIFKKLKLFTQESVGWGKINLPETTIHTTAAWWVLPPSLTAGFDTDRLQGALAAVSHALLNITPVYVMCDPRDLGRVYEIRSPPTAQPTLHLYERAPGGVGLAARMFRLHDHLVHAASELIEACGCESGCPSCVGPILEVGSTGKADALAVLRGGLMVPAPVPVSSVSA